MEMRGCSVGVHCTICAVVIGGMNEQTNEWRSRHKEENNYKYQETNVEGRNAESEISSHNRVTNFSNEVNNFFADLWKFFFFLNRVSVTMESFSS